MLDHIRNGLQQMRERMGAAWERTVGIGLTVWDMSFNRILASTVQGLVMQSMLLGDIQRVRTDAPGVYAIYQRGLRGVA